MDEILIKWRREHGYTQPEAAAIIGVCQTTYHNWESKKTTPRLKYLSKIATICKVDFSSIIPEGMTLEVSVPSNPNKEVVNALELYKKLNHAQDDTIASLKVQIEKLLAENERLRKLGE